MSGRIRHDAIERAITAYEEQVAGFVRLKDGACYRHDRLLRSNLELRRARQKLEEMLANFGLPYRYRGKAYRVDRGGFLIVDDTPSERSA